MRKISTRPKTVAIMSARIDGRTTNTETAIVLFRRKYLVFAPNCLSELNVGFGFEDVKPGRVR